MHGIGNKRDGRGNGSPDAKCVFAATVVAAVIVLLGGAAWAVAPTAAPAQTAAAGNHPDILVLLIDALRADEIGRKVGGTPVMPQLDAWAERTVRFLHARAVSPSTPTSVSSLMTSLPVRAYQGNFRQGIPDGATTVARRLREAGYRTIALSANPNCNPELHHDRGFQRFIRAYADPELAKNRRQLTPRRPARLVPPGALLDRARREIASGGKKPVFAYIHLLQPHAPYSPPAPHRGMFSFPGQVAVPVEAPEITKREKAGPLDAAFLKSLRARYDEHAHWVDAEVGRFLRWAGSHPRFSKAAIVVLSDHGEAFGEHGRLQHNTTLYEEMLRIPLLLRLPGKKDRPARISAPVDQLDLAPTLCRLAGLEPPSQFRGLNLLPLIGGKAREGRKRFLFSTANRNHSDGLLIGSLKVLRPFRGAAEVYDLDRDPREKHPLDGAVDSRTKTMIKALDQQIAWLEKSGFKAQPMISFSKQDRAILESLGYIGGQ